MRTVGSVLATVLLLVVSGCGNSEDDSSIERLEPTPTSTAITGTAAADPGERPDDEKTEAGAIAFSEFAVRSIVAARATGDAEDFLALSSASCTDCVDYGREIADSADTVFRYDGAVEVGGATVVDSNDEEFVIDQDADIPVGQEIDATDNTVVEQIEARVLPLRVRVVWSGEQWVIGGYTSNVDAS